MSREHLPRRPLLGVTCDSRLEVLRVLEGSGSDGKIEVGDFIREFAGERIWSTEQLAAAVKERAAGERVTVEIHRAGEWLKVEVVLGGMSEETYPDAQVEYGTITACGWRLRTIVTRPRTGGPGWLWIPGITCASQEFAADGSPARTVIAALTAAGATTLRVEPPGLGDSEGPDCAEVGFDAMVEVFAAGLAALRELAEPVAIFGHSVGGIVAPLLAHGSGVRGIAVFGTTPRPWSEYVRRSTGLEVEALSGEVKIGGRSAEYHRELARIDVAAAWAAVRADVAVMHGECDAVVPRTDAEELFEILSRRTDGNVTLCDVETAGHGLVPAEPVAQALLAWARPRGLARE